MTKTQAYKVMFTDYPDVCTIEQMCEMLNGISLRTGYKLLHSDAILHRRVGKRFLIPKVSIMEYLHVFDME